MKALACLLLLASLPLLASPALADDYVGFQSPTGNIHCAIHALAGGAEARCDLRELTQTYRKRPADCDLDWGSAFYVEDRGPSGMPCHGDTVRDPRNPVLPYGEAVSLGGISCVSAETGMTCTNRQGHGFRVARAKQRLF